MIDVYHGTGTIDWNKVKAAGHSAVYIKATQNSVDPALSYNIYNARKAGMIVGMYHYFVVNGDPNFQANLFINTAKAYGYNKNDLPLCIDLEDRPGLADIGVSSMRTNVNTFISKVESTMNGRKLVIYGDRDFLSNFGSSYSGHPLWHAQYTDSSTPTLPSGWKDWTFWQYSENGVVDGIEGNVVDLDRFNGNGEAGLREWISTH